MNASPELGEDTPRRLPTQLFPVLKYNPGKIAEPRDAEVIREHPPLYAGDYDPRKRAYYWECLKPNRGNVRLRQALHYGEERSPRCELCEKEDRACMSMLGKKYKTTGCARCIRKHFPCSQANGVKSATSNARKNPDDTVSGVSTKTEKVLTKYQYRPNSGARKRVLDREATEPPAKRTRASTSGKPFEALELGFVREDDETYHTPRESREGSVYTLGSDLQGSADSYRTSPNLSQAESHWVVGDEPLPEVDGAADFVPPNSSMTRTEQLARPAAWCFLGDQYQTNDRPKETQTNLTNEASSSSFGQLSRCFSNYEKTVLDLQSANATLTERVDQLESSRNSWQETQSRLLALESVSAPKNEDSQYAPGPATIRALESRILKLESADAGLDDSGVKEPIKRLEGLMERERRERRARVENLEKNIKRQRNDVAVLQSENEGLRERLNKLTGQIRNLTDELGLHPLEDVQPS